MQVRKYASRTGLKRGNSSVAKSTGVPSKFKLGAPRDKRHKTDYAAPAKPVLVDIKEAVYLVISGGGAPGGEIFQDKIGALYGVAFTLKMTRKFAGQQDYVALMQAHAASHGLTFHGRHHEIYLSDPRRIPPEKLKTILRQPVAARPQKPIRPQSLI